MEGEVWFDHQWGNFGPRASPGTGLRCSSMTAPASCSTNCSTRTAKALALAGTHTGADGRSVPLDEKAVSLTPEGVWRSAESGIRYPRRGSFGCPRGEM